MVADLVRLLEKDFALRPVAAAEIEFVLHGSGDNAADDFWQDVETACNDAAISIFKLEKERGREQYELALMPEAAPQAAEAGDRLKAIVSALAPQHGMRADFAARPFADQPGNGLHMHLHLEDNEQRSVFFKRDEVISDALKFAIGGLLSTMPESMPFFAPSAASYTRFARAGGPLAHAPSTVSWGANNRTTALRLPENVTGFRHIEHRVSGADAWVAGAMAAILAGVHYGLSEETVPGPQMYGDASLVMYAQPPLPESLEDALARMREGKILSRYFDVEALWQATQQNASPPPP